MFTLSTVFDVFFTTEDWVYNRMQRCCSSAGITISMLVSLSELRISLVLLKFHSSTRLRLPVSILGLGRICLLLLVQAYKLSAPGLIGQLKKCPEAQETLRIKPKRKTKSRKAIYQLVPIQRHNSFRTWFFFSKLNFLLPTWGEMSSWVQLQQKSVPVVLFLHGRFCHLWMGAQLRQNMWEHSSAEKHSWWQEWLECTAFALPLQNGVPSSKQVKCYHNKRHYNQYVHYCIAVNLIWQIPYISNYSTIQRVPYPVNSIKYGNSCLFFCISTD